MAPLCFITYLLGEKRANLLKFLKSVDRFQKSTHVEGSVGGLSVGLLSVLSHYTSIECNIHAVFNSFLRIY